MSALGVVLWTEDIGGLAAFLEAAAGATVRARHPGFAALDAGGGEILLHADESHPGHPWHGALAGEGVARGIGAEVRVRVDDVDAHHARALALGGVSIRPPYADEGARVCQIMGPDGYFFTLWEPRIGRGG